MNRPETADELMQFLQAVKWLHTSLLRMAEVIYPLRVFLEEHLAGSKRRTKRVATIRAISAGDWTSGLIGRGLGGSARSCRSRCVSVSPEAGIGGAHGSGCLR